MGQAEKLCRGCDRMLSVTSFSIDRVRRDGLNCRCRECVSAKNRARVEVCIDCGGPRSYCSGKRCGACYKKRSVERRSYFFFTWRSYYYNREAVAILFNAWLRWPEARSRLEELSDVMARRASQMGERDGVYWNPWMRSLSDRARGGEDDRTFEDLIATEYR
jgi:hypothetical protein